MFFPYFILFYFIFLFDLHHLYFATKCIIKKKSFWIFRDCSKRIYYSSAHSRLSWFLPYQTNLHEHALLHFTEWYVLSITWKRSIVDEAGARKWDKKMKDNGESDLLHWNQCRWYFRLNISSRFKRKQQETNLLSIKAFCDSFLHWYIVVINSIRLPNRTVTWLAYSLTHSSKDTFDETQTQMKPIFSIKA